MCHIITWKPIHCVCVFDVGAGTDEIYQIKKKFQISYKKASQNDKKNWTFVISIFYGSIIAKVIIKRQKTILILAQAPTFLLVFVFCKSTY